MDQCPSKMCSPPCSQPSQCPTHSSEHARLHRLGVLLRGTPQGLRTRAWLPAQSLEQRVTKSGIHIPSPQQAQDRALRGINTRAPTQRQRLRQREKERGTNRGRNEEAKTERDADGDGETEEDGETGSGGPAGGDSRACWVGARQASSQPSPRVS